MTSVRFLPTGCDWARQLISERLDSELSEVEETRLTAHLSRCRACSVVADEFEAVVVAVRALPLEKPPVHFVVPSRRRRGVVGRVLPTAAAAIAVLTAIGVAREFSRTQLRPDSVRDAGSDAQGSGGRLTVQEQRNFKEQLNEAHDGIGTQAVSLQLPQHHVPRGRR